MAITGEPERRADEGRRGAGGRVRRQGRGGRDPRGCLASRARRPSASDRLLTVSLAHSATAALVNVAQNALVTGTGAGTMGQRAPQSGPVPALRDGGPSHRARGGERCAVARLLPGARAPGPRRRIARYLTNAGRVEHRAAVWSARWTETLRAPAGRGVARADWRGSGVPAGVVRQVSEALADVDADRADGHRAARAGVGAAAAAAAGPAWSGGAGARVGGVRGVTTCPTTMSS